MQLPTSNSVQSVNVLPIPITVPVPIVSTELFSNSLQNQQQQQHSQLQQQPQQGPPQQEDNNLMSFQICPQQAEIIYGNMEASLNQQQRSS